MSHKIPSFEAIRVIALCAIITLHAQVFMLAPTQDGQPWIGLLINQLSRFAVPIFFILAGYFIQPKLMHRPYQTLSQYAKPLAKVWLGWSLICLFMPFKFTVLMTDGYLAERSGYWQYLMLSPLNSLLEGGLVHLWFIPSLIIAVALLALMIECRKVHWAIVAGLFCYLFGLLAGSYESLTQVSSAVLTRNGPFFSVLMVSIGFECRRKNIRLSSTKALVVMLFGMLLHLSEARFLMGYGVAFNSHDFLVGTPLWGAGLFLLLQNKPNFGDRPWVHFLAANSLSIYLCHLLVIILLGNLFAAYHVDHIVSSLLYVPVTLALSCLIVMCIQASPLKLVLVR